MAVEIERKYLVRSTEWRVVATGPARIVQGYFCKDDRLIGRVRKIGNRGYLAVKGRRVGYSRPEFEFEIPAGQADEMLSLFCADALICKDRFEVSFADRRWFIDCYQGDNEGLVVAEVELISESDAVVLPGWVAEEITGVARYRNSNLACLSFQDRKQRWPAATSSHAKADSMIWASPETGDIALEAVSGAAFH